MEASGNSHLVGIMRIVFDPDHEPAIGRFKDAVVEDATNELTYIYDCCGTFVTIPQDLNQLITFTADDSISIEHNMGKFPSVTIMLANGVEIEGDVQHTDANELTVTLSEPLTGKISLN
jgi:hypothetical protein